MLSNGQVPRGEKVDHILVTGGAGFIGSNLVHYLLRNFPETRVTVLDLLTYAGNLENLQEAQAHPNFEFVQGDIRDHETVHRTILKCQSRRGSPVMIHLAAETHVDRSVLSGKEFVSTNVQGTQVLLEAALEHRLQIFLHVSTDEVYGSCPQGAFKETDPLSPSSPYSASKAGADLLVQAFWKTYRLPIKIVRPSNNFGPYQYPEKLIPLFVTNALEDKPLPLYGDGKNVRDWLHVEDACKAITLVLEKGDDGEIYNVGGGNQHTNLEISQKLLQILGKSPDLIQFVKDRPGHDLRYAVDSSRLFALGWKPERNFEEALESTVRWYLEHEPWWRKIKEKSREFKSFYSAYYEKRLR